MASGVELAFGIGPALKILSEATRFVNLVSFQLTSRDVIDLLSRRAGEGLDVQVITLPSDSYAKEEERHLISSLHATMRDNGVRLYFCDWEVGAPELTETSQSGAIREGGGTKWYSLHGKFIVTDRCAMISSSNLTDEQQWEMYLTIYDNDAVSEFQRKFEYVKSLFIENSKSDLSVRGQIFDMLSLELRDTVLGLWKTEQRKNIEQYPQELSPSTDIRRGLHIAPFEGRARNFLNQIVETAGRHLYISSERIYDDEAVAELKKKAIASGIDVRIVAGPPSKIRENPSKAESQALELLASGVHFSVRDDIHAKMWLSEKWLMIGSPNIGKMNLGFRKTGDSWRANTETLYFIDDPSILVEAKSQFENLFAMSTGVSQLMAERSNRLSEAQQIFDSFGVRSRKQAKVTLSRVGIKLKIKSTVDLIRIARIAARLSQVLKSGFVEREHVLMSLILFFLQQRKHEKKELEEKLSELAPVEEIDSSLKRLVAIDYCSYAEGSYMINVEKVIA